MTFIVCLLMVKVTYTYVDTTFYIAYQRINWCGNYSKVTTTQYSKVKFIAINSESIVSVMTIQGMVFNLLIQEHNMTFTILIIFTWNAQRGSQLAYNNTDMYSYNCFMRKGGWICMYTHQ